MTKRDHPSSGRDAARTLGAYLTRVDLQLARAGMARSERDATCRQIVEQFHDLLPVPVEHATATQVEAALGHLSSEVAYASDDVLSRSQLLRMLWHRFWIGTPVPIALNDHGRKRIAWGELIKRVGLVYVFVLLGGMIISLMLMGELTSGVLLFIVMFAAIFPLSVAFQISRGPVELLPRAEDWPVDRLRRHRFAGLLVIGGSFVFVLALFPGIYCVVAAVSNRPIWPVDQGLFLAVVLTLVGLGMLFLFVEAWRRRRRRLQFQRWADGSP